MYYNLTVPVHIVQTYRFKAKFAISVFIVFKNYLSQINFHFKSREQSQAQY